MRTWIPIKRTLSLIDMCFLFHLARIARRTNLSEGLACACPHNMDHRIHSEIRYCLSLAGHESHLWSTLREHVPYGQRNCIPWLASAQVLC